MMFLQGNVEVVVRWRVVTGYQIGGIVQKRVPGDHDVMRWKIAKRLVNSGTVDFISTAESFEELSDGSLVSSSIE